MELKETYNKIAEDWATDHDKDTWWQEGTSQFLSLLPKSSTILDVGCGAGRKTRYISDAGYNISGVDFSEKMIEIARRENLDLEFNVLDVYEMDTLQTKYDAVFVQAVLLHIPKTRIIEVLRKIKSILKPGGFLYIAVKCIREDGVEEKVVTENDYGYEYSRFFSYYGMDELKKYLEELSFEIVWETKADNTKRTWLQVVAKNHN